MGPGTQIRNRTLPIDKPGFSPKQGKGSFSLSKISEMKNQIFILLFLPFAVSAQSVGVGTKTPHSSAIFDIESNAKGLLIPRLTTLQRSSIEGPAIGLMVYDTDTHSFWVYRGDIQGGWNDLDNKWQLNGLNIYNLNSGNVGIGTGSPTEKLTLNAPNATMQFMNSGTPRGYLQTNGADMRLGTYANNTTGNLVFNTKAVDRMWIDETGRVGIGTASPASLLTINGTNPYLQLQHNNVNTGFVQAVGVHLKIGTNSTNTTGNLIFQTKLIDRLTIDENGQVGIGTTTPTSILSVNAVNPIVQLKNAGVDKGFIQLVDDDLKVGTNLGNTTGKFIVRTKGVDRLTVSDNGKVGIGTTATNYIFDVNGYSRFSDHVWIEGNLYSENIEIAPSGISPELKLVRSEGIGTIGGLKIDENNHLKLSKGFYGGGIIIDANTQSGTKRFYASKGNQFNFGTGLTPTGYTVSVEGKVIATDFTTAAINNWPDYVFSGDYKLRPLVEVKQFINENKHLPNIPAAAEIEKKGLELGDMTKRLMEKVEELTLYIIGLQEQIDALKKINPNPGQ